jgi:hypothetical protein
MALLLATLPYLLRSSAGSLEIGTSAQITNDGRGKVLAGTDGSRLYLQYASSLVGNSSPIGQVSSTGGDVVPISAPTLSMQILGVSSRRQLSSHF